MVAWLNHMKCIRRGITVGDQEAKINHLGNILNGYLIAHLNLWVESPKIAVMGLTNDDVFPWFRSQSRLNARFFLQSSELGPPQGPQPLTRRPVRPPPPVGSRGGGGGSQLGRGDKHCGTLESRYICILWYRLLYFREEPDELFKDLPAVEDLSSSSEDEK